MKPIIVPIDFSEQSEYALKVAASLAKNHKTEVIVLHMLELNEAMISTSEGYYPEQTLFFIKLAEKKLNEFLNKPYLKGVPITPVIKHFKVFSEVNEVASKHKAGMIVMGSHGTDGLKEIFIGSNAEKVVRHSEVPVLVIKNDHHDFKVERFVFACDLSAENKNAFQKARNFAAELSASMDLVYINTPGDRFLSSEDIHKKVAEFLHLCGVAMEVEIYNDYSVEKGILNYTEKVGADLVGIPTHGRKGLSHFFIGSIGEDVANHSRIPVITFTI